MVHILNRKKNQPNLTQRWISCCKKNEVKIAIVNAFNKVKRMLSQNEKARILSRKRSFNRKIRRFEVWSAWQRRNTLSSPPHMGTPKLQLFTQQLLMRMTLRLPEDYPGGPVVKTPCIQCRGCSSIPGQGTKIPCAMWCCQKPKQNKNKDCQKIAYTTKDI